MPTPLSNTGYCSICRAQRVFTATGEWLRDQYLCAGCGSIPRQRALVHVLDTIRPDWPALTIHESSPTLDYFARTCRSYSCSYFFGDTPPGEYKGDQRCENLEALTFANDSFDVFITQDVLEHVVRPAPALGEIMRVLRSGGLHIFTTPKHRDLLESRPRVEPDGQGVRHLLDPVYHGSPIDDGKSLVTWDYGADFERRLRDWSSYLTSTYVLQDRRLGIDGEFMEVFVTVKAPVNAVPWVLPT